MLWVRISAREVVLSKPQLDHELTADPEGARICCVHNTVYVLYKKLSSTQKNIEAKVLMMVKLKYATSPEYLFYVTFNIKKMFQ